MKNRALGERVGYHAGRVTRASLAFVVCGVVLVLLWLGWFPDLRAPGADLRRVATATVLTGCSRSRSRRACAPPSAAAPPAGRRSPTRSWACCC